MSSQHVIKETNAVTPRSFCSTSTHSSGILFFRTLSIYANLSRLALPGRTVILHSVPFSGLVGDRQTVFIGNKCFTQVQAKCIWFWPIPIVLYRPPYCVQQSWVCLEWCVNRDVSVALALITIRRSHIEECSRPGGSQ